MNFTEHMKRIIQLAEQCLVHAQAGKFKPAADDLLCISNHVDEAMQQLDDISLITYQGKNPDKKLDGGT